MLKRKLYEDLLKWHRAPKRKALLVTGARQVGKSYLIRTLAQSEYRSFVEFNLFENPAARRALAQARDAADFISRVTILADKQLTPGESLVFIDEVQELPDVMTWAKFLVEDGRFDWAFSGSMLGTELKGIRSYPVGSVHELTMRPMDYEEFCWAIDVSEGALAEVRLACEEERQVEAYIHDAMLANFRTYLVVGGMPEVVQRFLDSHGDFGEVRALQGELNGQYRRDISKYAGSRALYVQSIFDELPVQLEGHSQRFVLNSVDPEARFEKYQRDFVWLVNAGVALKTECVTEPVSPLSRTASASKFKLYQSDTGMLVSRYPVSIAQAVYLDERHPNLGAIYENVVAQELAQQGHELYYHMTKKRGEVDFVVDASDGTAVPLEVKSGAYYHAHAALNHMMETAGYGARLGIVLSRGNIERCGSILYLPIYATFCLPGLLASDEGKGFRLQTHPV